MTLNHSSGSQLKPIETHYKGYRFRSRLEARWAVFFDTLGIEWVYEPEGFDLGDGFYYLPDFRLIEARLPLWIEIKSNKPTEEEIEKATRLHQQSKDIVVITWDDFEPRDYARFCYTPTSLMFHTDDQGIFHCDKFGGLIAIAVNRKSDSGIKEALKAARSARFEHGETP